MSLEYNVMSQIMSQTNRERKFQRANVPGSEYSWVRKFQGVRRPGSERAREWKFQGANWPESYCKLTIVMHLWPFSNRRTRNVFMIWYDMIWYIGRFAPGSEMARKRKGCESWQIWGRCVVYYTAGSWPMRQLWLVRGLYRPYTR